MGTTEGMRARGHAPRTWRQMWPPVITIECDQCGGKGAQSIDGSEIWLGAELTGPCPGAIAAPVALDWQTSTEHRGLQGVAFPETITRGEQGALL